MSANIKISILGDICGDRNFCNYFENNDEFTFCSLKEQLASSNLVIANLEAPATSNFTPISKCGPTLHFKPNDICIIKDLGVDVLTMANNHILDSGENALLETLEYANKNDIIFCGAGRNTVEASKPLFVEVNGYKIGILNFAEEEFNIASSNTAGANLFDPYSSLNDIGQASKLCDFLIVVYHGGIEHYKLPSPLLQKKCHAMVDFGANIVLCQHSHCIGTYEKYNGGEILYGQGNAIFGYREGKVAWNEGFLVELNISKNNVKTNFILLKALQDRVYVATEQETVIRLNEMMKDSERLNDTDYIKSQWNEFCSKQEPLYIALFYGWNKVLNKMNRIFKNKLAKCIISKKKRQISMNLIRCDAHHEVIKTILENTQ